MRPRLTLARQLLALQLLVLLVAVLVAGALAVRQLRGQLTAKESARALAVAEAVAALPQVREAFDAPDPSAVLQPIAESTRRASDLTFVVVADRDQVRLAHPDPALLGQRLSTDASDALAGAEVVTTERGTLGRSVRAKVPVRDDAGQVVGVVSVGSLEGRIGDQLRAGLPRFLVFLLAGLVVGVAGSLLLARRVRRQTYGLEPAEIGGLLQQREATLHGIREGLLVTDLAGRVTVVNDEAVRLLDLPDDAVGRTVADLALPPRLTEVLSGTTTGDDEIVLRAGRVLVLNRMPVEVQGRATGSVVTLRDRTELDELTRELDGARSTTDALRAQAHEFANRMHTVAGLLELREYDEALSLVARLSAAQDLLAERLLGQVGDPSLAALLLAKASSARERGLELRLHPATQLPAEVGVDPDALITVVGNLIDNALEVLAGTGGWVQVLVTTDAEGVHVEVRDSGPGVAPELAEEVFEHGFTTKVARSGGARGLGLALTRQACVTRGGWVRVRNDDGAVFTALLPRDRVRALGSR